MYARHVLRKKGPVLRLQTSFVWENVPQTVIEGTHESKPRIKESQPVESGYQGSPGFSGGGGAITVTCDKGEDGNTGQPVCGPLPAQAEEKILSAFCNHGIACRAEKVQANHQDDSNAF